tara:strand:+ start:10032 stop:12986 length:2955 start_codon:yes stop_codon:yes gene_type:complete
MKPFTILFFSIIFLNSFSQAPTYEWASKIGNSGQDQGQAIDVDFEGNVLTTGWFYSTVDFDPSSNSSNLSSSGDKDIFIQKLDSTGAIKWAKRIGGTGADYGLSIITDSIGGVYISGVFSGTVDFNPGVASYTLTAIGSNDAFVVKLDSLGIFAWAARLGGSSWDGARTVIMDNHGDILVSGWFRGSASISIGTGSYSLSSSGNHDGFIMKLSAIGNFIWAKHVGGSSFDTSYGMDVDNDDNIFIAGEFSGTADFDPSSSTNSLTSHGDKEGYVLKLNKNGLFLWVKQFGGTGEDLAIFVGTDTAGNVFMTGRFSSTVDFNPGTGVDSRTSAGSDDIILVKLSPSGTYIWGRNFGSSGSDTGQGLDVDRSGNIYLSGAFRSTIDFDPGTSISNLTSNGARDVFLLKLNTSGNFRWARSFGGSGDERGKEIRLNTKTGVLVQTGWFRNSVDFNFNSGVNNLMSSGSDDAFVAQFKVCYPTASTLNVSTCSSYTSPSGNYTWSTPGTYTDVISNLAGCDSVITINLTLNNTVGSISSVSCGPYTSPSGNYVWSTTGTYYDTVANSVGCDSMITINLTVNNSSTANLTIARCHSYTSPSGNYIWTNSGTFNDTIVNSVGCDSLLTIHLSINSSYSTINPVSCGSYTTPSGIVLSSTGVYSDTVSNYLGCDSIITIDLMVDTNFANTEIINACLNYTWPVNGVTYYSSTIDTARFTKSSGCDSIRILNLTVGTGVFKNVMTAVACDSFASPTGNNIWTISGVYYDTSYSSLGCDSIFEVHLTILNSSASTLTETSCGAYTAPDGNQYSTDGHYTAIITNSEGCDSVISIDLTVTIIDTSVTQSGPELIASATGLTYQWLDCSNVMAPIAGATNRSFTPSQNGNYAVEITDKICVEESNCHSVTGVGLNEISLVGISIYPNPVRKEFKVDKGTNDKLELQLQDVTGKIIMERILTDKISEINVNLLSAGIYFVTLKSEGAQMVEKIIIQ